MSTANSLRLWLEKMGFDGQIPEDLSSICNPSTAFIWEQVISNIKPKQEVDYIRKNLIINRLKNEQQEGLFPIKEIEAYKKKQKLCKKVETLENEIKEKEELLDNLEKSNKMTYVSIQNIKEKIKENNQKTYIAEQKIASLQKEIKSVEEKYQTLKNYTPVEEERNDAEINVTLTECAKKLKTIVEKTCPKPLNTTKIFSSSKLSNCTIQPTTLNFSSFEGNKENFSFRTSSNKKPTCEKNKSLRKKVFHLEGFNEEDDKVFLSPVFRPIQETPKTGKKKRESLGLLPPSCLENINADDDEFLTSFSSKVEPLEGPNTTIQDSTDATDNFDALFKNDTVNESLRNLLHSTNRCQIVRNCKLELETLIEKTRTLVINNKSCEDNGDTSVNRKTEKDLMQLYFIHVKNELETIKCRAVVKNLEEKLASKKSEVLLSISENAGLDKIKEEKTAFIEFKLEEAKLDAAIKFLKKEHANIESQSVARFKNDVILTEIKKLNEEYSIKVGKIEGYIENILKIFNLIKEAREKALESVQSVAQFTYDLSWAEHLQQQLCSDEIKIFEKFPLHFNKKKNLDDQMWKPPVSNVIPSYINLNSDELAMFTTIVDIPFSPVESIIFNILHMQNKVRRLEALPPPISCPEIETLEEKQLKDERDDEFMSKNEEFLHSERVKKILAAPKVMEKNMEEWFEAPIRHYLPESAQVDGHDYKYYETVIKRYTFNF